jgi:hypothetical protein
MLSAYRKEGRIALRLLAKRGNFCSFSLERTHGKKFLTLSSFSPTEEARDVPGVSWKSAKSYHVPVLKK